MSAESLRPYADAPCPLHESLVEYDMSTPAQDVRCHHCKGAITDTGLDPRFAALRGEHEWYVQRSAYHCYRCSGWKNDANVARFVSPYCLRSDVGSVLRAAAACGFMVIIDGPEPQWLATMGKGGDTNEVVMRPGDTLEDAVAAAFAAAVALPVPAPS